MLSAIAKPFGLLLMWLYEILGNYGLAVIIFALIVKIILLPFQLKAKKSSVKMTALQGQLAEIEKKHGANKQKYNEEVQRLYREENVKPMSGCIWSLIPFPILLALYQAIRYPITIMLGVDSALLAEGGAIYEMLQKLNFTSTMNAAYEQIEQMQFISRPENWSYFEGLSDKLQQINYNFLGLDLGAKPALNSLWNGEGDVAAMCLLLIPVLAGVLTYLQTVISQKLTKQSNNNPQQQTMNTMNILMPLMTVYFAYIMPAALGVYWIAGSVFAIVQEVAFNRAFEKQIEEANREIKEHAAKREAELAAKRAETERLKKENATVRNENTSKKKIQSSEKREQKNRAEEWEKKKTSSDEEYNPSQVDDRKYARGRAYDPDRYTRTAEEAPTAEEETAVISAETETVEEPVEETVVTDAPETSEEDVVEAADDAEEADEPSDEEEEDE